MDIQDRRVGHIGVESIVGMRCLFLFFFSLSDQSIYISHNKIRKGLDLEKTLIQSDHSKVFR